MCPFYGFCFGLRGVCGILEMVKIELESCGIDLFILGGVIWVISLFLLLFLTYFSIAPFKFPQIRRMCERFSPKTCDFIIEAIYFASLLMFIGGAALILWYCC